MEVSPRGKGVHGLSPGATVIGMRKVRGRGQVKKAKTCHPGQPEEPVTPAPRAGGAGRCRRIRHGKPRWVYKLMSTSSRGSPIHFCYV